MLAVVSPTRTVTAEQVDNECQISNYQHMEISSAKVGTNARSGFRLEELWAGRFVGFCIAPFMPQLTREISRNTE